MKTILPILNQTTRGDESIYPSFIFLVMSCTNTN